MAIPQRLAKKIWKASIKSEVGREPSDNEPWREIPMTLQQLRRCKAKTDAALAFYRYVSSWTFTNLQALNTVGEQAAYLARTTDPDPNANQDVEAAAANLA